MPEVIYKYNDFEYYSKEKVEALFWIVEYRNVSETERFSLVRNECLNYPLNFKDRLNEGVYRIWTVTPYEKQWQ